MRSGTSEAAPPAPRIRTLLRSASAQRQHDQRPPLRIRRERPVVSQLMPSRCRYERRKPLQKFAWLHDDRRRPVPPRVAQAVLQPAIGHQLQPLSRQRRAQDVSTEPLEAATVPRAQHWTDVEIETVHCPALVRAQIRAPCQPGQHDLPQGTARAARAALTASSTPSMHPRDCGRPVDIGRLRRRRLMRPDAAARIALPTLARR